MKKNLILKTTMISLSCLLGVSTAAFVVASPKEATTVKAGTETSVITADAGTGVSAVYVSNKNDGTDLQPSGSSLSLGMVYCYAVLERGYFSYTYWDLISGVEDSEGALYLVESYMNAGVNHYFGYISAHVKQTEVDIVDGGFLCR